jgi:hypothetical protein
MHPVAAQHSYTGARNGVIFECERCGKLWDKTTDEEPQEPLHSDAPADFDAGLAYRCNQPKRDKFYRAARPKIYSAEK